MTQNPIHHLAGPELELEGAPAGSIIDRVRYRSFRVIRVVATALGVPNAALGLWQIRAAGQPAGRAIGLVALILVVIGFTWTVTERNLRRGAALFVALLGCLTLASLLIVGLAPGPTLLVALLSISCTVLFGTGAGVVAFAGIAALLLARTAWLYVYGEPPMPFPGALSVPPGIFLRYTTALLATSGIMLALVSAVVRGLEDATLQLTEALGRERTERVARIASERELSRARQVEAIARLTRGVVHDTNNALVALQAGVEELRDAPLAPPDPQVVADMERALVAAKETMRQVLSLGRRPAPPEARAVPIALGPVVEGFARGFRRLVPESVTIGYETRAAAAACVDGAMLEQALLNLALNARDALPGRGQIVLRVDACERAGVLLALVEVRDDGPGLPDEVRAHLFEPGFTTKPAGAGSGLGLSMVQRFARSAGGEIEVESEPGRGTCFRLVLPRAAERAAAAT